MCGSRIDVGVDDNVGEVVNVGVVDVVGVGRWCPSIYGGHGYPYWCIVLFEVIHYLI